MFLLNSTAAEGASVPASSTLLARSRKVASLGKWGEYCWMPEGRLLLIKGKKISEENPNAEFVSQYRYSVSILDIHKGKRWKLQGLTHALNRMGWSTGQYVPSPTGCWIFWITTQTGDQWPMPATARIDGAFYYDEWSQDRGSFTRWVDAHHWIERGVRANPDHLTLHDVRYPTRDHEYLLASRRGKALLRSRMGKPANIFVASDQPIGSDGHHTIQEYDAEQYMAREEPVPLHVFKVSLPRKSEIVQIAASPRGARVVYLLNSPRRIDYQVSSYTAISLWTSDRNGAHPKLLGRLRVHHSAGDYSRFDEVKEVALSPDGHRVSFAYRGGLYLLPVVPP